MFCFAATCDMIRFFIFVLSALTDPGLISTRAFRMAAFVLAEVSAAVVSFLQNTLARASLIARTYNPQSDPFVCCGVLSSTNLASKYYCIH